MLIADGPQSSPAPEMLKLARFPHLLVASLAVYVDHSHCLVLAPATLAALPSTRAIPDRDVFYVAHPIRSILLNSYVFDPVCLPIRLHIGTIFLALWYALVRVCDPKI